MAPPRDGPGGDGSGWSTGAFDRPYVAFDARLLALNDALCGELLAACHLVGVPPDDAADAPPAGRRGAAPAPGGGAGAPASPPPGAGAADVLDLGPFVSASADTFALDRPCLVCGVIELYRRRFGLSPQWAADYAFLCAKCLGAPHCATATFVAAFEFVHVMDRHYLGRRGATLVGAFNRFALTINDIHRHFFLHCCFRTDGGVPGRGARPGAGGTPKVLYSNYSFLAQAATRALFGTLAAGGEGGDEPPAGPTRPPPAALATALVNWKDCARAMDCTEGRRAGAASCCARAAARDAEFEAAAAGGGPGAPPVGDDGETWGYADLALLLLAGTPALREDSATARAAADARTRAVREAWAGGRAGRERDAAPRFARFAAAGAEPDADLGPLAATVLKHARARGSTGAECPLCNLLLVRPYWLALRRLRRDVLGHSANNAGLFDCIAPVLEGWAEPGSGAAPDDGGRLLGLLRAAGVAAVYKHLFCDPMCAVAEVDADPWVLFGHPTDAAPDALALHKARLACGNRFEGRVCAALRALAYTFKTYQVFVPKPTALAAFVREAGALLRRHALSLVSLEHTISTYA
ncbi:DNA packaging protein UL32 [Ateline alphaherpesvirus 1]|uniref:Packaging protein UL32 n=1 Tax=Herpesvirus ateles type 1 (strain Lennette) TaxID=35243 RepID=A0A1S6JLN0_HSVA1|nr:DNA packaging protein UL32 [Ateline alphaherpesvirus 1]AQS79183.1 DNA packaging protein UL32 [Ateline alphaherpesvirus 1]